MMKLCPRALLFLNLIFIAVFSHTAWKGEMHLICLLAACTAPGEGEVDVLCRQHLQHALWTRVLGVMLGQCQG